MTKNDDLARFEELRDSTAAAIRSTAAGVFQSVARADLAGFALVADSDVTSFYHVYCTRDWVAERAGDYPDIGFIAVEWLQTADERLFDSANLMLKEWQWRKEIHELRFLALVEAMAACRAEGLFDGSTLLAVSGADPDDDVAKMECNAATYLNDAGTAAAYRKAICC